MMGWPEDITPDDWEVTRIIAIGKKTGKKISYMVDSIFRSNKKWKGAAGRVAVGVSASIAAQILAKGEIETKGAVPPEICIKPEPFLAELTKRDIKVQETIKIST
jgi:saccharopine dehydrogenase-like NADP-dependent oxidoreductase